MSCSSPRALASVTDEELVGIARDTPEAQAFLGRYPDAGAGVDRSGRVAVDFRAVGTRGVRLRVFIEAGPRASGAFLECPQGQLIQQHVADAARQGCPG